MKGEVTISIDVFDVLRKSNEDLKLIKDMLKEVSIKRTDIIEAHNRPFAFGGGLAYIDMTEREMSDMLVKLKGIK